MDSEGSNPQRPPEAGPPDLRRRVRAGLRALTRRWKNITGWDSQISPRPLACSMAEEPPAPTIPVIDAPPSLDAPVSQMATYDQFESETYRRWCREMQVELQSHRKQWEHCYILQVLEHRGMLREGARALGFGVGREPTPAILAARGLEVVATDMDPEGASQQGWTGSNQFAGKLEGLNDKGLCDPELFARRARYRTVDMNHLPDDLGTFDVVWSACALEHLGDLERGLDFVLASTRLLAPGGVAVHTTEYNLSSNVDTVVSGPTVFYRRRDLEALARMLTAQGDRIVLNFHPGDRDEDRFIQSPPYESNFHLKIWSDEFAITSFGLVIERNPFPQGGG